MEDSKSDNDPWGNWQMNPEQNALLTKVGAGTRMGKLMRRYWHPIAASAQLPSPDCPPLTTWLLGERFVVFRDTSGRVGVLDDHCLHRGVSLGLGRVEDGGIRCIYHGWKFDVNGAILDTPNHPVCSYREKKKARAFPVRERAGLIWTYIGPAELEPAFREFDFETVPETHRSVIRANTHANFLALWEGGVDSSHVGMLHTNNVRSSWVARARGEDAPPSAWDSLAPTYEVEDTDYGFRYIAFRAIPNREDARHGRLTTVMMPCMRMIPGGDFDIAIIDVPMSDTETATYQIPYSHSRPIERAWAMAFLGFANPLYDEKSCWVNMRWPHQMQQDRSVMKTNWSGYAGIELEDVAMSLSLSDWDRSGENLVAADIAVMRLRQTLLGAVARHEAGEPPPAIARSDMRRVVSFDRMVLASENWKAL